tara:strand:+ start:4131 stop:4496 length:366 start_codon:yes stop_codon:yes gene_type:complete
MLYINKGTSNSYVVELTGVSTLINPFYLFELISDFNQEDYILFNCDDLSAYKCRYNLFDIIEDINENLEDGIVNLNSGSYKLNIYESTIKTLDKDLTTGDIIYNGKAFVSGEDLSINKIYR